MLYVQGLNDARPSINIMEISVKRLGSLERELREGEERIPIREEATQSFASSKKQGPEGRGGTEQMTMSKSRRLIRQIAKHAGGRYGNIRSAPHIR